MSEPNIAKPRRRPLPSGIGVAQKRQAAVMPRAISQRHPGGRPVFGFTLIELMIVVLIISILATLAVPSYRSYIIRATRSDAQALMLELATREHQYFMANRSYGDTTDLGFSMPHDLVSDYDATFVVDVGPPPGFTITFTPLENGAQASDGALTIDSAGNKTPVEKWEK